MSIGSGRQNDTYAMDANEFVKIFVNAVLL